MCKNRKYRSSINISLYIFKNIKIYFKIILEIFFFISSIKYVSISFVFVFFILESGAEAGKGIYPERKENINIFFLILTPLKNFPNSTPAQNTNAIWIFLFMLLVYKFQEIFTKKKRKVEELTAEAG